MPDDDSHQDSARDALVASAKTDRAAFGELYEAYYERIFRYCRRRLFERTAAEDVTGEAFLFVARNMRTFRGTTDQDFRRWIYRIATTEINAWIRRTRRRRELWNHALDQNRLQPRDAATADEPWEPLDWPLVQHAMAHLSQRDQALVTLKLLEDMPYEDIAHVLNIRPGAARTAYSRALARLRELVTTGRGGAQRSALPSV